MALFKPNPESGVYWFGRCFMLIPLQTQRGLMRTYLILSLGLVIFALLLVLELLVLIRRRPYWHIKGKISSVVAKEAPAPFEDAIRNNERLMPPTRQAEIIALKKKINNPPNVDGGRWNHTV